MVEPGSPENGNADGDSDADGGKSVWRDLRQRPRPRTRHCEDPFRGEYL